MKNELKNRRAQKQKQKISWIIIIGIFLIIASGLILNAFNKTIVFYHTIAEATSGAIADKEYFRVGGMIKSVETKADETKFILTDGKNNLNAVFNGLKPALFVKDSGGVAEGYLENGTFIAKELLAKHDENYIPKEVKDSLKQSGMWNGKK